MFRIVFFSTADHTWEGAIADPWYSALLKSLQEPTGTWFVAAVIAVLTVFSNRIVESIKFALNHADLRSGSHEKLSENLSEGPGRAG